MLSHQMTPFLCLCLSGFWLVQGKPSSALPLARVDFQGSQSKDSGPLHLVPEKLYLSPKGHGLESNLPSTLHQPIVKDFAQSDGIRKKRTPSGFSARGFHENVFDRDFGHFSPVKRMQKRRQEADAAGFYGDTFSNGFGEFETMKRDGSYLSEAEIRQLLKRTEMGANGFHGDTFNQGFGNFDTMKKRLANWADGGVMKRKPEMTKSGFHADVFNSGFGEFHPMKK